MHYSTENSQAAIFLSNNLTGFTSIHPKRRVTPGPARQVLEPIPCSDSVYRIGSAPYIECTLGLRLFACRWLVFEKKTFSPFPLTDSAGRYLKRSIFNYVIYRSGKSRVIIQCGCAQPTYFSRLQPHALPMRPFSRVHYGNFCSPLLQKSGLESSTSVVHSGACGTTR